MLARKTMGWSTYAGCSKKCGDHSKVVVIRLCRRSLHQVIVTVLNVDSILQSLITNNSHAIAESVVFQGVLSE